MAPQRISCPRGRLRRSSNDVIAGYIMGSYNVRLFDNPRPVAEHGSPIKAAVAEASLPKIHLLNLAPVGRIKSTAAQVVKSWAAPLLSLRGQCLNGVDPSFNMRKPLSIGMFVRARFETGLFRFPSGEPAHAAWLSRRLPGKLISAGSCGCASGGQPGMSAHPTAFRFSVRRYRTNPVFCRARPGGCPSKRS